jgi:deoxyribonuclease V
MNRDVGALTGDTVALRELQREIAAQVEVRDRFPTPLRTVAGFDARVEDDGATLRAAAVLIDADTLEVLDAQVARLRAPMPDTPGLLSFRMVPAMLEALALLRHAPDLAFVGGQGIAHPHRLGIAAHFGVASGLPSVGVAGSILLGESRMALHEMRGAFTPLRDGQVQIGWLLRSKPGCPPLVVSPGHRVAMPSAPQLVMRFVTGDRLPETMRRAADLASRRAVEV